ncbi:MAG TPA: four helix bundle protein [Chitinophagales bacterium]|nr:four helix bundle protein [Chitinophagales bacterium]
MDYVVKVYEVTNHFPTTEKYGLVTQMNRAAVSVPSNIAEGAGKIRKMNFCNFFR